MKDGAGDVLGDLAEAGFTGLQGRGRLALFGHIARNRVDQAVPDQEADQRSQR